MYKYNLFTFWQGPLWKVHIWRCTLYVFVFVQQYKSLFDRVSRVLRVWMEDKTRRYIYYALFDDLYVNNVTFSEFCIHGMFQREKSVFWLRRKISELKAKRPKYCLFLSLFVFKIVKVNCWATNNSFRLKQL